MGGGHKRATADEDQIRHWWRRWPHANVGIALAPSGLLVVDPDSPAATAEAEALGLRPTPIRRSRSDAYLYAKPHGCPLERAIHKGTSGQIDVLTDGYLVAHGRHLSGADVFIERLSDPHPAPEWAVDILRQQVEERAAKRSAARGTPGEPTDLEDREVLELAGASRVGDRFKRLWEGDTTLWLGEGPPYSSQSEADQALMNYLCFFAGRDAERLDRLFRSSGLMRVKWASSASYRAATIGMAIKATPVCFGEDDRSVPRMGSIRTAQGAGSVVETDKIAAHAAGNRPRGRLKGGGPRRRSIERLRRAFGLTTGRRDARPAQRYGDD